ncbi:MAG TPA: DUF2066 domain-containing protein [Candidatus Sulfotelmatobacter sp.]|nr:DUF2066 domain-containing protein [Candidatus Sulfotelmatobacter sp.]
MAQSADLFSLRNVQVDIQGGNIAQARDQALAEARQQAYQQLMQRLTAPSDWPRIPKLSDTELQDIVLDVGVDQEKRSSVRYLASLSVRFKPDGVRRILRNANIAYAEWRGRPVAVIPVYMADAGPVLFEPVNPWREAWKSPSSQGIVPLAVPNPPPADQADPAISAPAPAAALAAPETLAAFASKAATQDVLIAVAQPKALEGNKVRLDLTLSGLGPVAGPLTGTRAYEGQPGESFDVVMRRAVEDIARSVNDGWKSANLLQFDHPADFQVALQLTGGMAEWSQIRDKLVRVTPIRSYDIQSISRVEVQLLLHTVGEQRQLEQVLNQNGLVLSWAEDHWLLQGTQARPAAQPVNKP